MKNETAWKNLRRVKNGLPEKTFAYFMECYDPEELYDAWEVFVNFNEEKEFSPEDPLAALFFPWYFQSWEIDEDNSSISKNMIVDLELEKEEEKYVSACVNASFGFYEVISANPEKSIMVKDLITLKDYLVLESTGSQMTKAGDLIFAKVINVNDINVFEAIAPMIIHPRFKIDIIKHQQKFKKKKDLELNLIDLYLHLYDMTLNPPPPTFTNTDGHLLKPQKLIFDINSPSEIFESIHSLCFSESREEILESAILDKNGNLVEVSFPWLAQGNKTHKSWENTVLGHIKIEATRMFVDVNSDERAADFLKKLKALKAKGWKLRATMLEPFEQTIKKSQAPDSSPDLSKDPQIAAMLEQRMQDHWDSWVDMKLPALGNKSPKNAIKTKKGRELVEALLSDFERSAVENSIPGQNVDIFKELRRKLGINY